MSEQAMAGRPVSEQLRSLVLDGLFTDGGHHKQWFLAQIAALVLSRYELEQTAGQYDPGVPA